MMPTTQLKHIFINLKLYSHILESYINRSIKYMHYKRDVMRYTYIFFRENIDAGVMKLWANVINEVSYLH